MALIRKYIIIAFLFNLALGDINTIKVGDSAPIINLFQLNTENYFRSKELIGKKNIVISFFGTWCAPCKKEIPELQKLYDTLDKDDYEFLLICVSNIKPPGSSVPYIEKPATINQFINKLKVSIPVLLDKYSISWSKYNSDGSFPLTVVINKEGKISFHKHGYEDGDAKILKKHLLKL